MSNIIEVMGATAGALALLDRLQENPKGRAVNNPLQKEVNFGKRFWIHTIPGEGGFEYGWDGRTPVTMKVTYAVNAPKRAYYRSTLPNRIVNTPEFQNWYATSDRTLYGTQKELIAELHRVAGAPQLNPRGIQMKKNPRGRSKRGVTRVSQFSKRKPTKRLIERRKKTLRAPRGFFANPAQSFPFVVEQQRAGSPSWRIVAAFKSRPEADAYAKALFRSDPYRGVRRRRLDKLVQRT